MASYKATRDSKAAGEDKDARRAEATSSPNELAQYRQMAQQNSIDALRAAEDRYEKAKQSIATAIGQTKDTAVHGVGAATAYVAGKGAQAMHGLHAAADYAAEKGRQGYEYGADKGSEGYEYTTEKAQQGLHAGKDTAVSAGQTTAERTQQMAGQTKDYLAQKAHETKDVMAHTSRKAMDYAGQKAEQAKDAAVGAGQSTADYASSKAGDTKEVTGEGKDRAMDAGRRAKNYAGEKGTQTRDTAVESGQKASESKHMLGEQTHGTREKFSDLSVGEGGKADIGEGKADDISADTGDKQYWRVEDLPPKSGDWKMCDVRYTESEGREAGEKKGGLLEAVGETVIDIAKSAKELVIGRD